MLPTPERCRNLLTTIVTVVTLVTVTLAAGDAQAQWRHEVQSLDHVHKVNELRLFYTLEGPNSLTGDRRLDDDQDGVPDYINFLERRLRLAIDGYTGELGLTHPLLNHRFTGRAHYIDIHVRDFGGKGSAGDGVHHLEYRAPATPSSSLAVSLATDLSADSLTPSHEVFHLFQYGYTMFKNRWMLEGLARWAEHPFANPVGEDRLWPTSAHELQALTDQTYQSESFWNELLHTCQAADTAETHTESAQHFTHILLSNFASMDGYAATDRDLDRYDWPEKIQMYEETNNHYIACGIKHSIVAACAKPDSQNIRTLLRALDDYTTSCPRVTAEHP